MPWRGHGYRPDGNENKGKEHAKYTPDLPAAGLYEVRMSYSTNRNRASNLPVTIVHTDGKDSVSINERKAPPIDGAWISLGQFHFEKGKAGHVEIRNDGTDGYVVIDAVQWLPVK